MNTDEDQAHQLDGTQKPAIFVWLPMLTLLKVGTDLDQQSRQKTQPCLQQWCGSRAFAECPATLPLLLPSPLCPVHSDVDYALMP